MQAGADSNPYLDAFLNGLKPDEKISLTEWADRYRFLSARASAEPGKFRTSRTPYICEVMDALSNGSPYEVVVLMFGAQLGKTETMLSWLGYISDVTPAPCMIVVPTLDMAKRFSKQRLDPMFEDTPKLNGILRPQRERDSGNSQLTKLFPGGLFILAGANSGASLRSAPIKFLALDECDSYPIIPDEGSPVELAMARTKTFSRRKILITSTPTVAGTSNVENFFLQGDQRFFEVPCPSCGEFQILKWDQVKWEGDDPETAYFECQVNGCRMEQKHKTKMLDGGRWVATAVPKNPRIVSFHLNSLYAPMGWYGLPDAVRMYQRAKGNSELMRSFTNTYLAETWQEKGEAPDWEKLFRRREKYRIGSVPNGVVFVTVGVDVQKDRVEWEAVGWTRDKRSYSIEYGVFSGDTSTIDSSVWGELDKLMAHEFEGEGGQLYNVKLLGIDTGYNTQTVYQWVRRHLGNRVAAIKGSDSAASIVGIPRPVDVTVSGKQIKRGLKLWSVGVSLLKSEIYGHLNLDPPLKEGDPYPAGYCHFPEHPEDYFKMLTAEQLMVRTVRGYRRYEWQKLRDRNEALDCRVYARAAASIVGMDRWRDAQWDALKPKAEEKQPESQPVIKHAQQPETAPQVQTQKMMEPAKIKRRRSNYW